MIVEAFNEMPDRELVVIGAGDEYDLYGRWPSQILKFWGIRVMRSLISYMQEGQKLFVYGAIGRDFGNCPQFGGLMALVGTSLVNRPFWGRGG